MESHGALIGNDYCIVSGFLNGIDACTPNIYCIDTQDSSKDWVQRVSLQDSDSIEGTKLGTGISHGAETVIGSRFYMCGGVSHHCFHDSSLKASFLPKIDLHSSLGVIQARLSRIAGTTIMHQTRSTPLQACPSLVVVGRSCTVHSKTF